MGIIDLRMVAPVVHHWSLLTPSLKVVIGLGDVSVAGRPEDVYESEELSKILELPWGW